MGMLVLSVLLIVSTFSGLLAERDNTRFHSRERDRIVQLHNELRRKIYAANMRELVWDNRAAHESARWGKKCKYIVTKNKTMGQNVHFFVDPPQDSLPEKLFEDSFKGWSEEGIHFDNRKYHNCGPKKVCSYVQLITADVQKVGCSVTKCPELTLEDTHEIVKNTILVVCNYKPGIEILNQEPYIPAKPCSACPTGTKCIDRLCSKNTSPSVSIGASRIQVHIEDKTNDVKELRQSPDIIVSPDRIQQYNRERLRPPSNPDDKINVVAAFPGKLEREEVRRMARYERRRQRERNQPGTAVKELTGSESSTSSATSTGDARLSRKKRQTSRGDLYERRRLQYERHLRELHRQRKERERQKLLADERERQRIEAQGRDRQRLEALRRQRERDRRLRDQQLRDRNERERRRRLREQNRRRLARLVEPGRGSLTSEEQFFTISAHNLLRRESGLGDLSWDSRIERWARYVIRCEIEYPGPITMYTNFGKAQQGQDVYNVVYRWGAESELPGQRLEHGCRTPYDRTRCNHNSIIRNRQITKFACASLDCGSQRQLTCIYSR